MVNVVFGRVGRRDNPGGAIDQINTLYSFWVSRRREVL